MIDKLKNKMGSLSLVQLASALCLLALGSCDSGRAVPVLRKPIGSAGTGCYFVVLREKTSEVEMQQLMATISKYAEDAKIYSVVKRVAKTFTVKLSPYALELVRRMPAVEYVEEEGFAVGTQSLPEWYLDRLDQILPTLDNGYWPVGDARDVDVYILDSGINYDHEEFEHRAKYPGLDPTDEYNTNFPDLALERQYGRDCNGHGTHVSSLCGGKTYGSAKKVTLYSVRVLGCNNAGPWSVVLEGIDFAVSMAERTMRPSILSMSFSGDYYQTVNNAITSALNRGVQCVIAAGNGRTDSCSSSPASNARGITVGGTKQGDGLYAATNYGRCVDIFAPGERILAADVACNNCSQYLSGTSMSTPLVSGLAAIVLGREPLLSADQLKAKVIEQSIKGAIDYTGIPDNQKTMTPNRLATVQGSCGEKESRFGHFKISSPNFPAGYSPNLDCRWEIGGGAGIMIRVHIDFLDLEPFYDTLRVFDGCCEDHNSLERVFTGNLRNANISFNSTGNLVCIQFLSDGTGSAAGFNGSYTKYYAGSNLRVPNPTIAPPPPTSRADTQTTLLMSPSQARNKIETLMTDGYKLTWISSYRLGPDKIPYFDFVASNSSLVDTISYVEIGYTKLNRTIQEMHVKGYHVRLLIDRIRGQDPMELSYSVLFEPRDDIFETEVYLRDTYTEYLSRHDRNTEVGYMLISHSFCSIQGRVEVSSVYVRDRRLELSIATPEYPSLAVRSNLTFYEFTRTTLRFANMGYFPNAVEVYTHGNASKSYFSVIYEERTENSHGNWFRWSLNTTAARSLVTRETQRSWDVYLTVGYTYRGNTEHFIEFKRKTL